MPETTETTITPATNADAATHAPPQRTDQASAALSAIDVRDLVKRYASAPQNAVDNITFAVRRGEIFGLLGPNGAGKTTTIGVLTTGVQPTSGYAAIMGVDVARNPVAAKQRIAVVPQQSNLDRSLRVREILTFHGAYHGVPKDEREARADALLTEMGLIERKNDKPDRYSGGMNQRLMIARALMHSPDVLFLDEPTNNLDPQSRLFLWDRIRALNAQGLTILLTTHDISEADQLCQRVAIMDHGKILVNDTPEALKKMIPGGTALEVRVSIPELLAAQAEGADSKDSSATAAAQVATERILSALRSVAGVTKVDEANAKPAVPTIPAGFAAAGAAPAGGDSKTDGKADKAGKAGKPDKKRGNRGGGGSPWGNFGGFAGGAGFGGPPAQEEAEEGTTLFRLYAENTAGLVIGVSQALATCGAEVRDLHLKKPSLEDVFIYLTGRSLR